MAVNNTTNIPPMVRDYAIRNLLMVAFPPLVHASHAMPYNIPVKSGDTAVCIVTGKQIGRAHV